MARTYLQALFPLFVSLFFFPRKKEKGFPLLSGLTITSCNSNKHNMNILTQYFNTKHNTAPFSQIKNEDYLPAIKKGIEIAKAEIDAIVKILKENPNISIEIDGFHNGAGPLTIDDERADRIKEIFIAKGIKEDLITSVGKGESTNCITDSEEGKDSNGNPWNCNMRVEINIVKF